MHNFIHYNLSNRIATITMDDGKVNCISPQMLSELDAALDQAQADNAVVILTGREGKFSAGFDLNVLKQNNTDSHAMLIAGFELGERLLSFPTPVIAVCTGHALAMGAFLLLCADIRIGCQGDYKIGVNEVAIGLTMPHFGVEVCRQRLTPAYFSRAVITAEIYTPEEAARAGFLDRAVPAAELSTVTQQIARSLSTLNIPAHTTTKLRARASTLQAVRAAIEADDKIMRARHQ